MSQRSYAAGRVAFLGLLDEIREGLEAGVPVQQVYDARRERLGGITYRQFFRYVSRYITRRPGRLHVEKATGVGRVTAERSPRPKVKLQVVSHSTGPIVAQVEERKGFDFHAEASDKVKKDWLV